MGKLNTAPQKGMRDLTPKEVELRDYVKDIILSTYKKYGFSKIETPCIENIDFLSTGDGGENEKLIFKILKRGKKLKLDQYMDQNSLVDSALRYDLTVPLSRFFANNQGKLFSPFKVIQIGSVWRAERPQKGRFRQFTQCDIDIIGENSIFAEIDLISATSKALVNLGFRNFTIRLNDRSILKGLAEELNFEKDKFNNLFIIMDKLDKIGVDGVKKSLEKAEFNSESVNKLINILKDIENSETTVDKIEKYIPNIDKNSLKNLDFVVKTIRNISNNDFNIKMDLTLVRGLGYYTGQIFEIELEGFNSAIGGGGRYDNMVTKMVGGRDKIPACGFSIGFERVISILEEQNFTPPKKREKVAIIFDKKGDNFDPLFQKMEELRENYFVSMFVKKKNLSKQINRLKDGGFDKFIIYKGENEFSELKDI